MIWIKNTIKYWFVFWLHRNKTNPQLSVSQRTIFLAHQRNNSQGFVPKLEATGYKVFSQFEEDGFFVFIFSMLGEGRKTFVEVGSNDGINSNCANLAIHFGWTGLFLEGNETLIKRGRKFYAKIPTPYHSKVQFTKAFVTRENINELIKNAGIDGEIELLSIDIDGNDYWIWDAISIIQPKVVVMEVHVEFGHEEKVIEYKENYVYKGEGFANHGASALSMNQLATKKGYRLIGSNDLGINQIYIKENFLTKELPTISFHETLRHPLTIADFNK